MKTRIERRGVAMLVAGVTIVIVVALFSVPAAAGFAAGALGGLIAFAKVVRQRPVMIPTAITVSTIATTGEDYLRLRNLKDAAGAARWPRPLPPRSGLC